MVRVRPSVTLHNSEMLYVTSMKMQCMVVVDNVMWCPTRDYSYQVVVMKHWRWWTHGDKQMLRVFCEVVRTQRHWKEAPTPAVTY